jgi:hypothetical protein
MEFDCVFPSFSDERNARQSQNPAMKATYILELEAGGSWTGILTGNVGPVGITVIEGPATFNLVEVTKVGIMNLTTLEPDIPSKTAKAVHSRHIAYPAMDLWMPSQWYGTCSIQ